MKDEERREPKKGSPYRFQCGTHETAAEVALRVDEIYQEAKEDERSF